MSPDDNLLLFRRAGSGLARGELRAFHRMLQADVAGGRPFRCLLTDDRELRRLNSAFLQKDYPTDVLSFPSESEVEMGDIAISVDRAREQAIEYRHRLEEEIKILMLHGVLHLMGMDHERDRGKMRREEQRWQRQLRLAPGLIERVRK